MLVFGHRGASGYAPENTLASFDLAIRQGCAGLECDTQLTRDGDVVIHHDWAVDRTTNGSGQSRDLTGAGSRLTPSILETSDSHTPSI